MFDSLSVVCVCGGGGGALEKQNTSRRCKYSANNKNAIAEVLNRWTRKQTWLLHFLVAKHHLEVMNVLSA